MENAYAGFSSEFRLQEKESLRLLLQRFLEGIEGWFGLRSASSYRKLVL